MLNEFLEKGMKLNHCDENIKEVKKESEFRKYFLYKTIKKEKRLQFLFKYFTKKKWKRKQTS